MKELKCNGIGKEYGKKIVLSDINLTLEPGKIYGLIGRNGAGKTTLLSVMSAQNPASKGNVTLGDEDIWENQEALDNICFSRELNPVAGNNALSAMKIKEYLKMASIYYKNWDKATETELIKEFELDVNSKIMKLSKGMLSMVTIIVALASKAQYTFLDEPVAGLDVIVRDYFYHRLIEEYTETGRTFVISTHIIEEATNMFEEIIIIKNGEVLLQDDTQNLLERVYRVSGKEEDVDKAVRGLKTFHMEKNGRSKGVTVLLEDGESIDKTQDVTVQSVNLQNIFVALCGKNQ